MRARSATAAVWLLPAFALGALLRLWNLPAQVIGGDELHAVRAALAMPLSQILVTYRLADNSIPLTALDRLLMDAGVPLTEGLMRLPMLASGFALLLLLPLWAGTRLGRRTGAGLAWLASLSPVLVLYSRIARSYMPMLLAATVAAVAFEAWWRRRTLPRAVAYLAGAGLAVWFHLGAAPFVGAPFAFAAGDLVLARRPGRDGGPDRGERVRAARDLGLLALGLALLLAALLLPARESLAELIAANRSPRPAATWATVAGILRLQAGSARPAVAALFWATAAAGLVLLLRRDRRLGIYTLTLAAGQVAGILLLSPVGLDNAVVFGRYLIPVLPLVLLWVAVALAGPWRLDPAPGRRLSAVLAALFLAVLVAGGPFADPAVRRTPFLHHNDFVAFHVPRPTLPPEIVPPLYRRLAAEPGDGAVLEVPWSPGWGFSRVPPVYQEIHRRPVLLSAPGARVFAPGKVALRTLLPPTGEAFLASGARYVVVHLKPAWEEDRLLRSGAPEPSRMSPDLRRTLRVRGERTARQLAARWGPPVYADELIRVWDLDRVRAAGGGTQSTAAAAKARAAASMPARKPGGR